MQAPLASADRRSAARQSASRSLREGARDERRNLHHSPRRVVRGFAGALGARRRRVASRWSRAEARRTNMREPLPRRALKTERESARGKAGKSPGNSANVSRSAGRADERPARGAAGRGAPVKGASGHLRRSWCPEAARSGPRRHQGAAGGGKAAPASAFHRPNCASGASTRAAEGRRGAASGASPARRYAVSNRRYRRDRARRPDRPFSDRCQGARCVFVWASDQ